MREQWRATAHGIMETSNQRAHFVDLVIFIVRRVRILSDPLFGDIQQPVLLGQGRSTGLIPSPVTEAGEILLPQQ